MNWFKQLVTWIKRVFTKIEPAKVATPQEGLRGVGRPKQEICKDISRPVRWSALEWEAVNKAAEKRGLTVSAFIRQSVIAEAQKGN